jgi:hypothetical protein
MNVTAKLLSVFLVDKQFRGLRSRLAAAERFLAEQNKLIEQLDAKKASLDAQVRQITATASNFEGEMKRLDARMANCLWAHRAAFDAFVGVPRILLYDNLKSAVIQREGAAIRFNPEILKFAGHYRYEPRPVAVARGNQQGRVERAFRHRDAADRPDFCAMVA